MSSLAAGCARPNRRAPERGAARASRSHWMCRPRRFRSIDGGRLAPRVRAEQPFPQFVPAHVPRPGRSASLGNDSRTPYGLAYTLTTAAASIVSTTPCALRRSDPPFQRPGGPRTHHRCANHPFAGPAASTFSNDGAPPRVPIHFFARFPGVQNRHLQLALATTRGVSWRGLRRAPR